MVGYKIRKLMKRLECTQARLALEMNVSQPMISAWCNDVEKVSRYRLEQLQKIADYHDIKICFM